MLNTLYRKYQQVLNKRKLAMGGLNTGDPAIDGAIKVDQFVSQLGSGLVDALDKPDPNGFQSKTGTVLKSVFDNPSGAFGMLAPLSAGLGLLKAKVNQTQENNMNNNRTIQQRMQENSYSQAQLGANPTLATGNQNASYFKNGGVMTEELAPYGYMSKGGTLHMRMKGMGGPFEGTVDPSASFIKNDNDETSNPNLKRNFLSELMMKNGSAKMLSSDNTVIKGPSHAEGGVDIPELGTQVEGGETTKNNFVYSKQLGFAQQHLPIARAIGIIEKKPQTKERVNSLQRMMAREDELAQQQESFKKQNGIQ